MISIRQVLIQCYLLHGTIQREIDTVNSRGFVTPAHSPTVNSILQSLLSNHYKGPTLDEMLLKPQEERKKKIRKEVFLKLLLCSYSILLFQTFVATSRLLRDLLFINRRKSDTNFHNRAGGSLRAVGSYENLEGQIKDDLTPESFSFDSNLQKWVPNHSTPLSIFSLGEYCSRE